MYARACAHGARLPLTPELSAYTAYVSLAIGYAILTAALAYYASLDDRLRGFRALAVAFGFDTLRFVAALIAPHTGHPQAGLADPVLLVVSSAITAFAALRMSHRPERPLLLAALAVGAFFRLPELALV